MAHGFNFRPPTNKYGRRREAGGRFDPENRECLDAYSPRFAAATAASVCGLPSDRV